jgi:site-specific recombinase
MVELNELLSELRHEDTLAKRHVWMIRLLSWLRGKDVHSPAVVQRIKQFLDVLDAEPELQQRFKQWWALLDEQVDASTLLADFGFAVRSAFISELGNRLRLRLLPMTPETTDSAELFSLVINHPKDAQWIELLDAQTLNRLARLLRLPGRNPQSRHLSRWQEELLQAMQYCASQIRAAGLSADVRQRMDIETRQAEPFHGLAAEVEQFSKVYAQAGTIGTEVQDAALALKARLDACRGATQSVYAHLENNGISVELVFVLRQIRLRLLRMRELLDGLISSEASVASARLLAQLALRGQERSSIGALFSSSTSLLAAKMAERSAETGEHYITRNAAEYRTMLKQAAGGGAATALTTWAKFALGSLGLVAFWAGFASGLLYAASFVLIQLMHWTLATKQPAATAPAMAAKLTDIKDSQAVEAFTDEVSHLVRSQVAAVLGNVGLVMPTVLLISFGLHAFSGQAMITPEQAREVLDKLNLLHPSTLLFAAFTGILLFFSSLVAGWAENAFVLYRLDSAIRYNPRISAMLGQERALRWASFLRRNISGFAGNISLGMMLGIVPVLLAFFGLGLDVRHVTLSMGQLSASFATLALEQGAAILREPALWWCLLAIPLIGVANLSVSFYLAFQLASRAHVIGQEDRQRLRQSMWRRLRKKPLSFIAPTS